MPIGAGGSAARTKSATTAAKPGSRQRGALIAAPPHGEAVCDRGSALCWQPSQNHLERHECITVYLAGSFHPPEGQVTSLTLTNFTLTEIRGQCIVGGGSGALAAPTI